MLSMKAKYGLRAMMHLAETPDEFQQARAIAEAADVPLKFLEGILLDLRQGGLIETRRGAQGGYKLAHAPEKIPTGKIIRILDGMLAAIKCASQFKYEPCEDCRSPANCRIKHLMTDVRKSAADILDGRTLADLTPKKKDRINARKA